MEPVIEDRSAKREVSKVDLLADYLENSEKEEDKSERIGKEREK